MTTVPKSDLAHIKEALALLEQCKGLLCLAGDNLAMIDGFDDQFKLTKALRRRMQKAKRSIHVQMIRKYCPEQET